MCVEALPRAGRMGPKILKKCGQTNNRENVSTHFRMLLGENISKWKCDNNACLFCILKMGSTQFHLLLVSSVAVAKCKQIQLW